MSCPLSILIPARNEAANLAACLDSARFADEVVVVDSGSTDGTREIATAAGASLVDFRWDGRLPKKKNWALANVPWRHEWVFILDADERITPELAAELARVVLAPEADGYYVNRRFWFLGGWLRHCGYYPSWNLRLFRHRLGRYEQFDGVADTGSGDNEIHEHVVLRGRTGRLRYEMEHRAFPSIEVWVEKHNRYSNWEARLLASPRGPAAARAPPPARPRARPPGRRGRARRRARRPAGAQAAPQAPGLRPALPARPALLLPLRPPRGVSRRLPRLRLLQADGVL